LTSSHYAKETLTESERLNIKIVLKDSNPSNVPQLRPIERFWADLKKKVYENGWTTKSVEDLVKKLNQNRNKFGLRATETS
jgi:hypothetical protein